MQIAKHTKANNISEYVLYMYQIEDIIRANQLDLNTIETTILKPQIKDEALFSSYQSWYKTIINQMKVEGIQKKGHLSEINETLMEISLLHNTLINIVKDKKYLAAFEKALPNLKEFQSKSQSPDINIIEIGFNALYSKIILRLKKTTISSATEEAFETISTLFAYIAAYYKKMKAGDLSFANN